MLYKYGVASLLFVLIVLIGVFIIDYGFNTKTRPYVVNDETSVNRQNEIIKSIVEIQNKLNANNYDVTDELLKIKKLDTSLVHIYFRDWNKILLNSFRLGKKAYLKKDYNKAVRLFGNVKTLGHSEWFMPHNDYYLLRILLTGTQPVNSASIIEYFKNHSNSQYWQEILILALKRTNNKDKQEIIKYYRDHYHLNFNSPLNNKLKKELDNYE